MSFRDTYLDFAALTTQLETWAKAHPKLVRLASIGTSPGGRPLWVLTIGKEPAEPRPAVWVDGNMHASELCGSSVALAIAEDVIGIHQGNAPAGLPPHIAEVLRDIHFYIMPRISPDGAEAVLKSGRYVRSSPNDERPYQGHPHWRSEDLDGDGQIQNLRQKSPTGELAELPGFPGVLVPRILEDQGPFYKLYPEGRIVNFDGRKIPDPYFLSDNQTDFNRNFPYDWAPENVQEGAGDFPGSMPETRAVLAFASQHPNIYAWMNLHTFGGVFIRPPGAVPDSKMDQSDLAIFRQVEEWAEAFTTYPTVSGFHEFCYEPEKPLRGDLSEYAYNQRGAIAYVVELWDLFKQIGLPRKKPFVDAYSHLERKDLEALARWDRDVNQSRIFKPWKPLKHPQIGDVEVGGPDLRVGITNPPNEMLDGVCRGQSAAFLRVAALTPRVAVEVMGKEALPGGLTRLELKVHNPGYLATYGLPSAKKLPHSEPLRLVAEGKGVKLAAPGEAVTELGHLEGWGQGRFGTTIFAPWTRGSAQERRVTLVVEGKGELHVRIGGCRTGFIRLAIPI